MKTGSAIKIILSILNLFVLEACTNPSTSEIEKIIAGDLESSYPIKMEKIAIKKKGWSNVPTLYLVEFSIKFEYSEDCYYEEMFDFDRRNLLVCHSNSTYKNYMGRRITLHRLEKGTREIGEGELFLTKDKGGWHAYNEITILKRGKPADLANGFFSLP